MREAGDVCYADVFRDGTGVVEFVRKEDMTYAVRKLDNTKFRSHEVGFPSLTFGGTGLHLDAEGPKVRICSFSVRNLGRCREPVQSFRV